MLPNPFKSMPDPQTLYLQRLRDGIPVELAKAALNARTDEEAAIAEGAIARFVRLEEVGNSAALLAAARRHELGTYRATVDVTGNATTDPAGLQAARDDVARARAAREAAEERLRNAQE
jgi:hypothetical protein